MAKKLANLMHWNITYYFINCSVCESHFIPDATWIKHRRQIKQVQVRSDQSIFEGMTPQ